jgi:hydrogenase maturation protease
VLPSERKILVIGYGNPGRRDDGLGPALVAALEAEAPPHVTVAADYQLTVEDAAAVAAHEAVVFVDAAVSGAEPFAFAAVTPGEPLSFSSHSVSPAGVMALARECFQAQTAGYVLAIRGYEFNEFGEGLSAQAQANLAAALEFLRTILRERTFPEDIPHLTSGLACTAHAVPGAATAKGAFE